MRSALLAATIAGVLALACSTQESEDTTYFKRTISPILTNSCVRTNTGAACHVADPKGNAFGNLDTSTFEGLNHRRDLLADYGPYGQPAFLVKNVPNFQVEVQTFDGKKVVVTTDIKHTGGPILDPTAGAYQTLRRWIQNGASENNTGAPPSNAQRAPCGTVVPPPGGGFDPNVDPPNGDFSGTFKTRVNPIIRDTCAAGNCHGTSSNDLYLTCGDSPEQLRWNYFAATKYLAQTPEQSELARRPLAPAQGGAFHEGGIIFESSTDDRYHAILDWAKEHGPPDFGNVDPLLLFFAHRVQPVLVKKGCMMIQCHSPAQFHDYRLRGGSGGSFSFTATRRNYELSLAQLSVESEDVNASRIVRKNLFRPEVAPGSAGIAHRGGPLLEDFGQELASGKQCDAKTYDYENGNLDEIPAYCIIREWHRRERDAKKPAPLSAIVYVKRPIPSGSDRPLDFDSYAPGAELHIAQAALDATGNVTVSGDTTANGGCSLPAATADIRRPSVSWDAKHVAFAARPSQNDPFSVYTMNPDGSSCVRVGEIGEHPPSANGLLVHDFDPAFAPDGTIVFASTRGNIANPGAFDYSGPQRTPANPARANANLYVLGPDKKVRQLTFLLNTERMPSFMADGRLIFAAEKRAKDFYQIALRRMNLDGGDYHPLYAQRASIGYHEAFDVIELADKNFAAIFSEPGAAHRGGALGVFNRSIGVDFTATNPADYLIDASVIDPAAPASPEPSFFLHSLRFVDPGVSGRPGTPTNGLYTSPAPLPGGRMLVSFGAASDAGSFGGDYDLYVMDPVTGARNKLLGDGGSQEIEAVGVYGRQSNGIFVSGREEPNAFTTILPDKTEADILVHSMPVLASLLFQNTPTGRPLETFDSFEVWEDLPPPLEMSSFGGANVAQDAYGQVFVKRRMLGKVPLASDGSTHFTVPGGLPILFKLPETPESRGKNLPRVQKETFVYGPGEYTHQSFRRDFFDGLCAQCHGAVSGRPIDVAVQPDILTQASQTESRDTPPHDLNLPPAQRGQTEGP